MIQPQVQSVVGRILRNEIQLLYPIGQQGLGLGHNIALLSAAMRATHAWNDAEAARMIAALGNLHVGEMARREPKARRFVIGDVNGSRGDIEQRRGWRMADGGWR